MAAGYGEARVAFDAVIFTIRDGKLCALLRERETEPFKGLLELPGGLLRGEETIEEALERKLSDLLNENGIFFRQFHAFTDPLRDPRERTISIGFYAIAGAGSAAKLSGWAPVSDLPKLAFDHREIIRSAKSHLSESLGPDIAKRFLPDLFPLNSLQEVYGAVSGREYDNRNFRKWALGSGIVAETKREEAGVSHRPAKLFRFVKQPPI